MLSEPVQLDGRPVYTSGSIGVLLPSGSSMAAEEVMRDADAAMHAAKRRGNARFELFDAGMRGRAMERLEYAQGFFSGRPLPAAELAQLLDAAG